MRRSSWCLFNFCSTSDIARRSTTVHKDSPRVPRWRNSRLCGFFVHFNQHGECNVLFQITTNNNFQGQGHLTQRSLDYSVALTFWWGVIECHQSAVCHRRIATERRCNGCRAGALNDSPLFARCRLPANFYAPNSSRDSAIFAASNGQI